MRLKKDFVVPAGTALFDAPRKREYGHDAIEGVVGMGRDGVAYITIWKGDEGVDDLVDFDC